MFNICYQCGQYAADKTIDPQGPYAVCPFCGFRHLFRSLPLLMVTGASGAGKSVVCQHLVGSALPAVVLDSDILWRAEFNKPEQAYRDYFELWLRLCKNIAQAGRPVILFGAGSGVPANIEPCTERRYFAAVHYLALVCEDDALESRLRARPVWRNAAADAFIASQLAFNRWFKEQGPTLSPSIALIDTTSQSIAQTVRDVTVWIEAHLPPAKA